MIPKHRKPTHPGVLIQDLVDECNIIQTELAEKLNVSRLKRRIHKKR